MFRRTLIALASFALAVPCASFAASDAGTIKLGTMAGPHAAVAEQAAKVAAQKGLKVKIVEFSDYISVNEALLSKDLDANAYQHRPYLEKQSQQRGYKFAALGKTILFPLAAYSVKIHNIKDIHRGSLVAVPADPANCGRALQLLARKGLIELKPGVGPHATVFDITKNPLKIKVKEIESAYLSRSLPDVELAVINGSWALKAKLSPSKDALFVEDGQSDFSNVLVVREADKNRPEFKILLESFQSPQVKQFVLDTYKGSIVPAF